MPRTFASGALCVALCLACEPSSTVSDPAGGDRREGQGGEGNATSGGAGGSRESSGGLDDSEFGAGGSPSSSAGTSGSGESGGHAAEPGGSSAGEGGESTGGSGGAPASGAAGGGGVPISVGPVEVGRAVCDKLFECCTEAELAALPMGLGDAESSCQISVAVYLAVIVEASNESLAAGRIRYDGVALADCLEDYANEPCGVHEALDLGICPGVFAPQVELGGRCGISGDCIGGYCEGANDAANPVGTCAERKLDGAVCAANAECASGLCEALGDGCVPVSTAPICGG